MKKLVFMFVAMAAMTLAMTTTSCKKGAAQDTDSVADSAMVDSAADSTADSAAVDSAAAPADSVK